MAQRSQKSILFLCTANYNRALDSLGLRDANATSRFPIQVTTGSGDQGHDQAGEVGAGQAGGLKMNQVALCER